MKKGKEKHIFPGNNTPVGFYSYYQYILPQEEANHIFCLKGGPGVGKSTFMKTAGNRMQERGFSVEYLHCSSDPDSLDGVVIPKIHVALIDGTAPHVVDPINPGAVDEIINLGDYWDRDGIKQNKENVMKINGEVGRLFKRAYKYIAAARFLMDDVIEIYERATEESGAIIEAEIVINRELNRNTVRKFGKERKQFASAITPDGVLQYLDTLFDKSYHIYSIKNNWGVGVHNLLKRIADEAVKRGIDAELYYCPMRPEEKVEHVIIPELGLAFISESIHYDVPMEDFTEIDLDQYLNEESLKNYREFIEFGSKNSRMLLDEGIATLNKAKKMHDDMEEYYIPYMDFDKENEKLEEILSLILKYEK